MTNETLPLKTKVINVEANKYNDLFELIKSADAIALSMYVKNTYVGMIPACTIDFYELDTSINQLFIRCESGANLWLDSLHICDTNKRVVYIYSLKESEFYEQIMQ